MPILVAVLGVIIIALGVALFVIDKPAEESRPAAVEVREVESEPFVISSDNEAGEPAEEPLLEVEAEATIDVSDEPVSIAPATGARTLTASGSYTTPARTSHAIEVSLTLSGDIVTDAQVVYDGGAGFSNANQERFDNAYKTEVIGKSLGEISLSRVGGASLTSRAFNEAVAEIARTNQS